ncbi:hypothetical protein [Morganella morganii]|uniref:hypothetical protein n=1 Tax=Morganella morganii TaxID=582 RepID=UPI0023DD6D64|nr:hypothetical protein [Morganella morganii]MDF2407576.1 hypothetical protein [Morganella morganii]
MTDKTGGSAFPLPQGSETTSGCEGMTLRDYFAAKAMQGFFSSGTRASMGTRYKEDMEYLAVAFYSMADAMLRAREK